MSRLKFSLVILLCLIAAIPVLSQVNGNGAWQLLQNRAVSVRIPADWTGTNTMSGISAQLADAEVTLTVGTTLLSAGQTLETVAGAAQSNPAAGIAVENIALPAGDAVRLETMNEVEGRQIRTIQYLVTADNVLVTMTATIPEAPDQDRSQYLTLLDRIANTLTIEGGGWPRYVDVSGKISFQAPSDWLHKSTGDKVLTVIQPDSGQVITLNYRTLSQPMILEEAAQLILDAYVEQGINVAALDPVTLPAGEAYRALLLNVPAQNSANMTIQTQQYQYIILRDGTLILVNAGCETAQFEQCSPLLAQIVDTIVFDAP